MKTLLKAIWIDSAEFDLESYVPVEVDNFSLWLELRIGPELQDGADNFRLFVCTPSWLKNDGGSSFWGRFVLIVQVYDLEKIKAEIQCCIDQCDGASWAEVSRNLSKYFAWEFEGFYDSLKGVEW